MKIKLRSFGFVLIILFSVTGCVSNSFTVLNRGSISPNSFGLKQAKTGEERFEVLLNTHKAALQQGLVVDYSNIDTIDIIIPKGAESIPLGEYNDFSGTVFNVTNNMQNTFLFSFKNKAETIEVTAEAIDEGKFYNNPVLSNGTKLLVVEDQKPWVENRKGYTYGHIRRDIILIKNGRAKNKPVMPYNNANSSPVCKYYNVGSDLTITDLVLNRTSECTEKTFLCTVVGVDKVLLKDVVINTVPNDLVEDVAIHIADCSNISVENVRINGTYSRSNYSGYGISMNNIWNFYANGLYANGNWGIFGNNNINTATIENSEINRFDIHCYGRDVSFNNVTFINLYNQFSSTFGMIRFDNCVFKSFIPVLYESSYNTYVPHDVVFNNCEFYMNSSRNYMISAGYLSQDINSREELQKKCWPNLSINCMTVYVEDKTNQLYLFRCSKEPHFDDKIHYIDKISINGLEIKSDENQQPIIFDFVNNDINTERSLIINVNKLKAPLNSQLKIQFNNQDDYNKVAIRHSNIINNNKE